MLREFLFTPAIAPLLASRNLALALFGLASLQVGLYLLNLAHWQCPFLYLSGIPCPGCGLTRALVHLLYADWRTSLKLHALAPVFLAGLLLVGFTALLPKSPRRMLISGTQTVERHTGIIPLLLGVLFLYWLTRLLILQSAFAQLIRG